MPLQGLSHERMHSLATIETVTEDPDVLLLGQVLEHARSHRIALSYPAEIDVSSTPHKGIFMGQHLFESTERRHVMRSLRCRGLVNR